MTPNGLDVVRYASEFIVQTTIQEDHPSKIYVPIMTIKYAERNVKQLLTRGGVSEIKVQFNAEFTMQSKNFWNAIKILSGFILFIAIILWILRLYSWQNRTRSAIDLWNILHMTVIGLHTLVMILLPPILVICIVWYVCCCQYRFKLKQFVAIVITNHLTTTSYYPW